MTRALRDNSASKKASADVKPESSRRSVWRRFIDRLLRRKPPTTFGGMTYEQFGKFAAENPPPQAWHDQDVQGLRGPKQ